MQSFEEKDYEQVGKLIEDFLLKYAEKDSSMSDEEFLRNILADELPKMSKKKIAEMCREIFDSNKNIKDFLENAGKSAGYENATENWFCEKIKSSILNGDYDFIQRLCLQNEILNKVNHSSIQISEGFHGINFVPSPNEEIPFSAEEIIYPKSTLGKKSAPLNTNVHQAAIDAGVKKSIMTQYKRIMNLDFANLNVRADVSSIAANLSRNAALTGVCGMALTTGLSVLFKSSALRKNFTGLIIKTGTTDSLRVVVTGALKVGAERRMLPLLTRTTPMITLTAIALIAIESAKTIVQYVNGEIKCLEALNQVSKISTSAICSVIFGIQGGLFGAATLAAIPVASPLVGAFIGELIGTMAGYEVGRITYNNVKTLLINTRNILNANYGIMEMLNKENVLLTSKSNVILKAQSGLYW
ncbi:MAG: hypothetical protein IKZ53_01560 [Selenomonadaceae bacterium]|nr:hypothetical protein [Selenomonadaceae bacterium]